MLPFFNQPTHSGFLSFSSHVSFKSDLVSLAALARGRPTVDFPEENQADILSNEQQFSENSNPIPQIIIPDDSRVDDYMLSAAVNPNENPVVPEVDLNETPLIAENPANEDLLALYQESPPLTDASGHILIYPDQNTPTDFNNNFLTNPDPDALFDSILTGKPYGSPVVDPFDGTSPPGPPAPEISVTSPP